MFSQSVIETRAAIEGYLLHYWNVDCSDDSILTAEQNHLWLKNTQLKTVIDNISSPPGVSVILANTMTMEQ